ncbi:HesB/IscA family protein [Paenibacillus guangzhouensis]|uniref:HesB/IscA family protein n=1 Tax=Paenibacillus guangzhouensis TaxID=1473112 RepID=UPI002AB28186|nr:iron-sulfur cluster assembly accessory protein [Paenibacillus guangzhouensis]
MSDLASAQIKEMLHNQHADNLFLRVGVVDGGCSGLSYDMKFDDIQAKDDLAFEMKGFQLVIDSKSMAFLEGLKIDYVAQGMTGGFTMDNPNVKASCGCGASFRTATYRGSAKKC